MIFIFFFFKCVVDSLKFFFSIFIPGLCNGKFTKPLNSCFVLFFLIFFFFQLFSVAASRGRRCVEDKTDLLGFTAERSKSILVVFRYQKATDTSLVFKCTHHSSCKYEEVARFGLMCDVMFSTERSAGERTS